MFTSIACWRSTLASRTALFLLAAITLLFGSARVSADANCQPVNGHFSEQALSGPACTSPVGFCAEGAYSGALRGDFVAIASTLIPTADTPSMSVLLFTGDTTIHALVGSREGDLLLKNAGALHAAGIGEAVDLQIIVGGTGGLTGATGALQAIGTFTFASGGQAEYTGTICVP